MSHDSFKEKLLEEINKLPKGSFESVYQIIHFFRIELSKKRETSKKSFSKEFLQTFGSWHDSRSAEKISEEIHGSRCFMPDNLQW